MPKADHLITMCSAASTYSDIQEFKPIHRNLSQVSASGKKKTYLFYQLWLEQHNKLGTDPLQDRSLLNAEWLIYYWSPIMYRSVAVDTYQLGVVAESITPSPRTDRVLFVGCLVMFSPPWDAQAMGALYYIHVMSQHIWLIQSGETHTCGFEKPWGKKIFNISIYMFVCVNSGTQRVWSCTVYFFDTIYKC